MIVEPHPLSKEQFEKLKRLLKSAPPLECGALLTEQPTPWDNDEPYIMTETSLNITNEVL